MNDKRMRIAVIGAGAAGLTAAYLLQRRHAVTLYERGERVGGHVHTAWVPDGGHDGTSIDTGFVVYNERNYPLFTRLLAQLGVESRTTEMSFSYHDESSGLQYSGSGLNGLFAQRRNLVRPAFWRLLVGVVLFCRRARRALAEDALGAQTIGDFVASSRFGDTVARDFVLPMAAAIWSAPRTEIREFPAESILRFFSNHGLLQLRDRITWRTIVGGSETYVLRLLEHLRGAVVTGVRIAGVRRCDDAVKVRFDDGHSERFDQVVMATHADQALALLDDPSDDERRLLGAWRYSASELLLHTDESVMPPNRRAWAAWNYRRTAGGQESAPVTVSYHMNQLQGFATEHQYFVTLNSATSIADECVVAPYRYRHPCYELSAIETQTPLRALGDTGVTHFCGSYLGYGFHEDAVRSAADVAARFGIEL